MDLEKLPGAYGETLGGDLAFLCGVGAAKESDRVLENQINRDLHLQEGGKHMTSPISCRRFWRKEGAHSCCKQSGRKGCIMIE